MKFFADTASLGELKEMMSWGVVDGCTTNPKIVLREKGCNFETRMKDILSLIIGKPVSIEVTTNDTQEMIEEARKYNTWSGNVVVKIPMNENGLKAVKVLSAEGIKTNVTAIMNKNQAVMAAKAGATYVSIFWGRIEDMGYDAQQVVIDTVEILERSDITAKVIVGSFRRVSDVTRALSSKAHILTITYEVMKQMIYHPRTESTIQEFLDFWDEFKKTEAIK